MNRRKFLKSALIGSSALFIPNAVLAFGEKSNKKIHLDPKETFFVEPNLKDYKFNTDGTAFFNTKIGFRLDESKNVLLPQEFRISHDLNGYGIPAFYSDGKKQFVFVSELFLGSKMNGWIYEYDVKKGFTAHQAFQHENMGWYAFWGKPVNDKPALYHFNYNGFYMTQTAFLEEKWQTNRIYNTVPGEAIRLYESQVNHPDYPNQSNQFGFEWRVHPDGFYDFLKLKHAWEQSKLKIEKDELERREKLNPTVPCSLETETITQVIRNKQCLANSEGFCDCNGEPIISYDDVDKRHIRIVKTVNKNGRQFKTKSGEIAYSTTLGFYDDRNVYHEVAKDILCYEDAVSISYPVLYFDDTNYFLFTHCIDGNSMNGYVYKYNAKDGLKRETVFSDEIWGWKPFFGQRINNEPVIYHIDRSAANQQIKSVRNNGTWTHSKISVETSKMVEIANKQDKIVFKETVDFQYPRPESETPVKGYSNPFVPIYCEGDDLSRANPKPTVIYKEVAGTKIEIPNMPAIKTQNELGECRAFAVAALMQWYTCYKRKNEIPDCKNLPPKRAISYFGMMMYTHRDPNKDKTFQPDQDKVRGMYDIMNNIKANGAEFILESCKPFDVMVSNFKAGTEEGKKKIEAFFNYLRQIYDSNKGKTEVEIKDCLECIKEINRNVGVNATVESLKKSLQEDSFDKFLYSLFFDGCDLVPFPDTYQTMAYPDDSLNITPAQLKTKIIEVLKQGKPVMLPSLCTIPGNGYECKEGHALLVSGYKKVCFNNKSDCKDVFKVNNSWGEEWQKLNNDGWIDADELTKNNVKFWVNGVLRIDSASAIWLG